MHALALTLAGSVPLAEGRTALGAVAAVPAVPPCPPCPTSG